MKNTSNKRHQLYKCNSIKSTMHLHMHLYSYSIYLYVCMQNRAFRLRLIIYAAYRHRSHLICLKRFHLFTNRLHIPLLIFLYFCLANAFIYCFVPSLLDSRAFSFTSTVTIFIVFILFSCFLLPLGTSKANFFLYFCGSHK